MSNASAMTNPLAPWLPLTLQGVIAAAPVPLPAWQAPSPSSADNLTEAVYGSGTPGFALDASPAPGERYGAQNWCDMPRVRRGEYVKAPEEFELIYVELMQRHHKRTPYASNGFPVETYPWDCEDVRLHIFAEPIAGEDTPAAASVYREGYTSSTNPFRPAGWQGSCQFPQITAGGLLDSWRHGADLYDVYGSLLGLLPARSADGSVPNDSGVRYRVTSNPITSQVAGMVINGMWGATGPVPLLTQAESIDSLEPRYRCPRASALFSAITSDANSEWRRHLEASRPVFERLDRISGVLTDDAGFHVSFDHYFDNLSARQCHGKPLPCRQVDGQDSNGNTSNNSSSSSSDCVSQELADAVYRLGNWEYAHIFRGHPDSLAASAASLGVWVGELTTHLRDAMAGKRETVYFHNVAHDGSVSRLLSVLQIDRMMWPGMGSEVVFELYEKRRSADPLASVQEQEEEEGGGGGEGGGGEAAPRRHRQQQQQQQQQTILAASTDGGFYVRVLFGGRVLESSSPALGRIDMIPAETLLAYLDDLVGQGGRFAKERCQLG